MSRIKEGDIAWVGLLAYIVAYDAYAMTTGHETLSASYYRALQDPRRQWLTIVVWIGMTGHLFRLIPERYDLLRQIGIVARCIR